MWKAGYLVLKPSGFYLKSRVKIRCVDAWRSWFYSFVCATKIGSSRIRYSTKTVEQSGVRKVGDGYDDDNNNITNNKNDSD